MEKQMVEKIIMTTEFWAIVGVFVGFLLGEGSRYIRYKCRIRKLRAILRAELKSIAAQLEQKKDIVKQAIAHLKDGKVLPTSSVRVLQTGYIDNISELYTHLSDRERNCLHIIYERVRIADDLLDLFEAEFISAVRESVLPDPYGAYEARFSEVLISYDIVLELINSYLSKNPVDVFQERWKYPTP